MQDSTISFIGGGNMARSLIGGLIQSGCKADKIWVADPDERPLMSLSASFSVHTTQDNRHAVGQAEVLVLAIKPQILPQVAREIADLVHAQALFVISIAAGIRETDLRTWLGGKVAIVRAMPNTPALVQSGATALYANPHVNAAQRNLAESIMRAVGLTLWVEQEADMDTVTALSGSGPAYFFLVMEALEQAAVHQGLPRETAHLLTLQTAFGAAKMAIESEEAIAQLRARVTSPGGTTEKGVEKLQTGGMQALFNKAIQAARARSIELAEMLGEQCVEAQKND
jgi:pyrroline-5-carboxylate reductase